MSESIDLATARRLALGASGLLPQASAGGEAFPRGAAGAAAAIGRLGSVQIDTISVVERAHHHVLWSRVPGYRLDAIPRLEGEPRLVFEYWSHAAAYLPLGEYRFCLPRMDRIRAEGHQWFRADQKAVAYVRDRIRAEGPLRAQDFAEPMKGARGWWDWKPAKIALEYLFHAGELFCLRRVGFQKLYDLAERSLPPSLELAFPDAREQAARHVDRAAASLGIFAPREVAYLRKDGVAGIPEEIEARLESGSLVRVEVEGLAERSGRPLELLAEPAALEAAAAPPATRPRARILSPFDPAIIDRKRAARLLGLDYQLECYLPEAKRRFGYFALPILYVDGSGGSGFVGLADAKAEREEGLLRLCRLAVAAPGAWAGRRRPSASALASAIAAELRRFAAFNGAARVELGKVEAEDARFEPALEARLEEN
ncbi:MAG TPA: crosslink repair DNA glycosylase YcaQ family protein [Spirochaetia bacterium]|nr:crosslink repair DNA glycosylase YcaQ family protein [Spirochaetia bacterium]